jgi:hypothetical protein
VYVKGQTRYVKRKSHSNPSTFRYVPIKYTPVK